MLAVFEQALHLLFRAQTAETYQQVLMELLAMVEEWGAEGKLGGADADAVVAYLEEALGLAGTPWENAMGDFVSRGVRGHQSTNNSAESHFQLIDRCLFQGVLVGSFVELAEIVLGVTARGTVSSRMTCFGFFAMQRKERELNGGARLPGDILRRSLEGRWLNLTGCVEPVETSAVVITPPKFYYVVRESGSQEDRA